MLTRWFHHWTQNRLVRRVFPWVAFALLLCWGWRVYDILNRIPGYGDGLEVVWGIRQYHDALISSHTLPLFAPLVFAPNGWHTATLAHTPFLFLLAQPFCFIGGAAFAYNVLVLASLLVAYAGTYVLLRRFTTLMPAVAGALVYTFIYGRWFRVYGHLNILWATSLLPWLLIALVALKQADDPRVSRKMMLWGGVIWGLMVNFSYYSIFLAAVAFLVLGKRLFQIKYLKKVVVIALIAGLISAPILIVYEIGYRLDGTSPWSIMGVQVWGASLNSLIDISRSNPITLLRPLSLAIYSGPVDESGVHQLGLITGFMAVVGVVFICRKDRSNAGWLCLVGGALILSLGLLLKWNGKELSLPILRPLDAILWQIGHALKPGVFDSQIPQSPFETGIPLPGYALAAIIPFAESARVMSRYALVGGLGLIVVAAIGLKRVPGLIRWIFAAVWVLEGIPVPTGAGVPITTLQPHPAYAWLASQSLASGENVIDLAYPTIAIGGEIVYATLFHHQPTVSGVGSYFPKHTRYLFDHLVMDTMQDEGKALEDEAFVRLLSQYGVRYILFHLRDAQSKEMWNLVRQNPQIRTVQCFDPNPGQSPWRYPICVAEVLPQPINVITVAGWYPAEGWGIWAEGLTSQTQWVATTQANYQLTLSAFPYCVAQQKTTHQVLQLRVNDTELISHTWTNCEVWKEVVSIPQSLLKTGENKLSFSYSMATRPADNEPGNGDMRQLSVGFTQLNVKRK